MNLYKKVNEPLYKTDVCDMETLTDGQTNMTLYNIYEKKQWIRSWDITVTKGGDLLHHNSCIKRRV